MFSPVSPLTGAAQTGFTTPTYSFVSDIAPSQNGKQIAVTVAGGTQVGVTVHSVASPFTSTFVRPSVFKFLGMANPITNRIKDVPRNIYHLITRKGVTPLAGQPVTPALIRTTFEVPAGSDVADPANLKAMISHHIGLLSSISASIGDSVLSGTI